jgi:hypothetical protein
MDQRPSGSRPPEVIAEVAGVAAAVEAASVDSVVADLAEAEPAEAGDADRQGDAPISIRNMLQACKVDLRDLMLK